MGDFGEVQKNEENYYICFFFSLYIMHSKYTGLLTNARGYTNAALLIHT